MMMMMMKKKCGPLATADTVGAVAKTVKLVTSSKIQITPSLLALIMTNERMTNHNNQWVPPSLRK